MKRRYLCASVAILLSAGCLWGQYRAGGAYAGLYDSETVRSLKEHVRVLSSATMEGRRAGSDGEALAAGYVGEALAGHGVDLLSPRDGDCFGIGRPDGDTLTSRNVIGFIQGADPASYDRYVVIGARLDGLGADTLMVDGEPVRRIYHGANGNASGLAMLIELGRMLQTNRILLRRSVLLVAFGASGEMFAGSWYFLNRSFSDVDRIDAMVNLDMLGAGTGFYAYTASNPDMAAVAASLAGELQPIRPEVVAEEPYPSDHRAFYACEIPAVFFTTGRYPEHDTDRDLPAILDYDTMERELEYIYHYVMALCEGPAPRFGAGAAARSAEAGASPRTVSYYDTDVRPTFLGGGPEHFLEKWVYPYLRYPDSAVQEGVQGRVMVDFIIDEKGNVTDVKVSSRGDGRLEAEAVRVVEASPRWRPGRVRGKPVRTAVTLPVEFRLTKKGTFGIKK